MANKNRELCERLGRCWHYAKVSRHGYHLCSCGLSFEIGIDFLNHKNNNNPDYVADPRFVIREMEKRRCLDKFILYVWDKDIPPEYDGGLMHIDTCLEIVKLIAIDTTGKLTQIALDWLRKEG